MLDHKKSITLASCAVTCLTGSAEETHDSEKQTLNVPSNVTCSKIHPFDEMVLLQLCAMAIAAIKSKFGKSGPYLSSSIFSSRCYFISHKNCIAAKGLAELSLTLCRETSNFRKRQLTAYGS